MCTVVVLRRPEHLWPLVIAANRDESVGRAWLPPARHWPDRPEVVGGLDLEAGGSWLGLNDHGVAAAVLNRRHSLGPAPDKRSRGELVLEALDHADAIDAAHALAALDPHAYRPFNLMVADSRDAFWVKGLGDAGPRRVQVTPIPEGVAILTAWDLNDVSASERTRHYLPRFREAEPPDPGQGDWSAWESLLASEDRAAGVHDPNGAMHVVTDWGFGTVSTSLIAVPAPGTGALPVWRFARTWPVREPYVAVAL